ncbi:restriction endonuclease subunit S [Arcanobacterium buesumense]|uniref:Restriction endonuclease subunit S n=1 Tax=Arcanobacterium buesumense TaxID=2722751 RepID=A0A6H2EMT5_9ACTO|nr:restriction endonuclease subunit S [Arcanobacterium buesumense]QJC22384.1 restriction endonuclease subunit S [Arcanobacterium buesumense]
MNINELLARLSPTDIPLRVLGEVAEFSRGNGPQKKDLQTTGNPCIHYGQIYTHYRHSTKKTISYVSQSVYEKSKKAQTGDVIIADTSENNEDLGKAVAWLGSTPIAVSNHTLIAKTNLVPEYLAYFLASSSFDHQKRRFITGTKVRTISAKSLSKIIIPVPPLDIQREIVKILDMFTNLEAELEAELEARKKQYQFYRDSLLTFPPEGGRTRWTTLGEIGTFSRGIPIQKKDFVASGIPAVHYGEIYTHYGLSTTRTRSHIHSIPIAPSKLANYGNLIIATTSENSHDLAKSLTWLGVEKLAVSNDALIFRHELFPNYVSHFFASCHFHGQKNRLITGTKIKRISAKSLSQIRIPIPSLEEQKRIADILDKFDALVNDISSGLPAEIQARRQQYEYYRDALLSFPTPEE